MQISSELNMQVPSEKMKFQLWPQSNLILRGPAQFSKNGLTNDLTIFCAFSADGNYEVRYKSNVLIYPNGEVLWVPPAIYQVSFSS